MTVAVLSNREMNCNIAFLGDVGVGKTAIICRMLTGKALVKLIK